MSVVYISSTDKDLKDYRRRVADDLRRCGYTVDSMEKYPARDARPRNACEADAAKCDIYIGIFAWMYGSAPREDNPEEKSFTELEYLAAGRAQKPRFVFLMAEEFPWPSTLRDAEMDKDAGQRVRNLRNILKRERWAAFFETPDHLANQVLISLFQYESLKPVEIFELPAVDVDVLNLPDLFKVPKQLGGSPLPNIQQQIERSGSVEFGAIQLGPTPWWNTRLHLLAALALDFTKIKAFVIQDAQGRVLVVASPAEIRRALTRSNPKLEMAYLQSLVQAPGPPTNSLIDSIISVYPTQLMAAFGGQPETEVKQVVTSDEFGIRLNIKGEGEVLQELPRERKALLKGTAPYIVLP